MQVRDLINALSHLPEDAEVCDVRYNSVTDLIYEATEHTVFIDTDEESAS